MKTELGGEVFCRLPISSARQDADSRAYTGTNGETRDTDKAKTSRITAPVLYPTRQWYGEFPVYRAPFVHRTSMAPAGAASNWAKMMRMRMGHYRLAAGGNSLIAARPSLRS
jgi:hypothetical protein